VKYSLKVTQHRAKFRKFANTCTRTRGERERKGKKWMAVAGQEVAGGGSGHRQPSDRERVREREE